MNVRTFCTGVTASLLFLASTSFAPVHSQSTSAGGFGGGFGGASGGGFGSMGGASSSGFHGRSVGSRGSTAISDGTGGFTIYSQQGTSRYIDSPGAPGTVYHPDGSSSQVIEDGSGNLNVYGPQGTHKIFRDTPDTAGDRP